ncbi:hypothetical protein X975_12858, partial [Stegodyphus mimosarum]
MDFQLSIQVCKTMSSIVLEKRNFHQKILSLCSIKIYSLPAHLPRHFYRVFYPVLTVQIQLLPMLGWRHSWMS